MLRNLIGQSIFKEIYKIGDEVKRGAVVKKDLTAKEAIKADAVGVEIYFVDFDFQPTGARADMEVSEYTDEADIVQADTYALLVKPQVGETWGTDQVDATGLVAGDYVIAGTTTNVGKLVKATTGNVSVLKYVGTEDDNGHTLYAFEAVMPHTVA